MYGFVLLFICAAIIGGCLVLLTVQINAGSGSAFALATSLTSVRQWEHGWKTKHVIATRYSNPHVGFNIGMKFPTKPFDCDRKELFDFIEMNGGNIYQGGGYPGAEVFAVFDGVKDKTAANDFLPRFLPKLDRFVATL